MKFEDIIRGVVSFDAGLIGDVAIAKDVRTPLYNFAVVVDDEGMDITHVIRGEDHISNTPTQILLQRALGFREVAYAHLPLILAPNKSKLSKRTTGTSLMDYRRDGFLPDAIVNFIALLGWHPEKDREILSRDELVREFDIERVQKAGAVFNTEKLAWVNSHYIREMPLDELTSAVRRLLTEMYPDTAYDAELLRRILSVERVRMKKLSDIVSMGGFFFELPVYDVELLCWKDMSITDVRENLERILNALDDIAPEEFQEKQLNAAVDSLVENENRGPVFWPLRAALSGKTASPSPIEILIVLGKEEAIRRIKIAIGKLSADTDNGALEYQP